MAEIQTDSETVATELLYKSEEFGPAVEGPVARLGDSEELLLPGDTEAG